VFIREEFRGGQGGYAGGMNPIRGRELVAEGSIRRGRLERSVCDVPVNGNCMHHAEMHCLRRAARTPVRKETTNF
jgi:tRNA(Arg) A34 adenosine deaminase TadA